jgi:hypothetical protein
MAMSFWGMCIFEKLDFLEFQRTSIHQSSMMMHASNINSLHLPCPIDSFTAFSVIYDMSASTDPRKCHHYLMLTKPESVDPLFKGMKIENGTPHI